MEDGIEFDPLQEAVAVRLQSLHEELLAKASAAPQQKRWRLFGKRDEAVTETRGVYIHGGVGRGKTMLMDLLYAGVNIEAKRRAHFHAFMQEVHREINATQVTGGDNGGQGGDVIAPLIARIAAETKLLCFDEFHVTDIGDAMILGRLFTGLLDSGVVPVMTSNRAPDALYEGGINRQNFVPFIELVKARMDVVPLDGPNDYRQLFLREAQLYITPLGEGADKALARAFERLSGGTTFEPVDIEVQGRTLRVEKAAKGVAMLTFEELCAQPLGAADYLALEAAFHTVILNGIPCLTAEKRNEAKRFVTLIDVFYEHRVHLICAADAMPGELYPAGDGAFEFERTASRLTEMQSDAYIALAHRP